MDLLLQEDKRSTDARSAITTPAVIADAVPDKRQESRGTDSSPYEADDAEANDPGQILMGVKAIIGKAAFAAQAQARTDAAFIAKVQSERDDREAKEQASLAAWNHQRTTVGGVEMTNEEAQEARQRFIDNGDFYTERAVRLGLIKSEDKEELKRGIRRERELKDREGRGIITDAERKELSAWERSRVGQAGGFTLADIHQNKGIDADVSERHRFQQSDSSSLLLKADRTTSVARSDDVFQTTVKVAKDFSDAVAAPAPQSSQEPVVAPAPPSRKASASGLDM